MHVKSNLNLAKNTLKILNDLKQQKSVEILVMFKLNIILLTGNIGLFFYTPIALDERVIFWLQRAGSLPCTCVFAALYACVIA